MSCFNGKGDIDIANNLKIFTESSDIVQSRRQRDDAFKIIISEAINLAVLDNTCPKRTDLG